MNSRQKRNGLVDWILSIGEFQNPQDEVVSEIRIDENVDDNSRISVCFRETSSSKIGCGNFFTEEIIFLSDDINRVMLLCL